MPKFLDKIQFIDSSGELVTIDSEVPTISYIDEADSSLDNKITTERQARIAADSSLDNKITTLDNRINNLDYSDSAVGGQFVTSVSETDGVISVTRRVINSDDGVVLTSNTNQTIDGDKTFVNNAKVKSTLAKNAKPNSITWKGYDIIDSNDAKYGGIQSGIGKGSNYTMIQTFPKNGGDKSVLLETVGSSDDSNFGCVFRPGSKGDINLGNNEYRWKDLYTAGGSVEERLLEDDVIATFTILSSNSSISIKPGVGIMIDWGDGQRTLSTDAFYINHTYQNPGVYECRFKTGTTLNEGVFMSCYLLTSIVIPNNVTNIGSGAFYNCSGLTSVKLPSNPLTLGDIVFRGCTSLNGLAIQDGTVFTGSSSGNNQPFDSSTPNIYYSGNSIPSDYPTKYGGIWHANCSNVDLSKYTIIKTSDPDVPGADGVIVLYV